jgi:hypothetical protein
MNPTIQPVFFLLSFSFCRIIFLVCHNNTKMQDWLTETANHASNIYITFDE